MLQGIPLSNINFEPVFFTLQSKRVAIGPMEPGKKLTERYPIRLSEKYFGTVPILAEAAIDLPPGVALYVKVEAVEGNDLARDLIVTLKSPFFVKYKTPRDYTGRIRFISDDPVVNFPRDSVELTVLNPRPALTLFGWDCAALLKYLIATSASLVVIFIAALILMKRLRNKIKGMFNYLRSKLVKTRLVHLVRARPSGHLVLSRNASLEIEDEVFDLAKISQGSGKVILGIGVDRSNPIVLAHTSVEPFHCIIWAGRKRNPTRVYVERCSDGNLTVSGENVVTVRQLKDRDTIEIGEYQFEFVDTQFRYQVEVHLKDGTLHDGILEYWDLGQSLFYLTSQSQEEALTLYFPDVSYIHFYKDESERKVDILPYSFRRMSERQKQAVKITLGNGERLEGFVHKRYHHRSASGVFLLPVSGETKIQYTYIPRTSVESLVIVRGGKGSHP